MANYKRKLAIKILKEGNPVYYGINKRDKYGNRVRRRLYLERRTNELYYKEKNQKKYI